MRIWDIRPYAPGDRQLKLFLGAQHGFEKVSICLLLVFWYGTFRAFRICSDVVGHQMVKELQQDLLTGQLRILHLYLFDDYHYRFVYIWDTVTRRIVYKLPGHQGSVNDVDFHPKEPICKCVESWLLQ